MKITTEKTREGYVLTLFDRSDRRIVHNIGATPKEAATWMVRAVNRITGQCEDLIVGMGLLTEAEVEAAVATGDATEDATRSR